MKRVTLLLLVALILGSMCAPTVLAEDERVPEGSVEANRIVMNTERLTAIFEEKKPKITFYPTTQPATEYKLTFTRLVEFNDTNLDGAYQKEEEVAWADIESLTWAHTSFYDLTGPTLGRIGTSLNLTYSGPLPIERQGAPPEAAMAPAPFVVVKLLVKIYQYNVTDVKRVGDQDFAYSVIGGAEVKVDVIISSWPFGTDKNPKLALEIQLHSSHNRFEVEEKGGRRSVDANQAGVEEMKMEQTNAVEQKIRYLDATGEAAGFFKFVNFAIVKVAGKPTAVKVYASYVGEQEGGERRFKFFLAYPRFKGTLEHDPSFGIGEPVSPTPEETIPEFPHSAAIVLAMALGAVTLTLRTLKRDQEGSIKI